MFAELVFALPVKTRLYRSYISSYYLNVKIISTECLQDIGTTSEVLTVTATDVDIARNSLVTYSIEDGNVVSVSHFPFQVWSSAVVSMAASALHSKTYLSLCY